MKFLRWNYLKYTPDADFVKFEDKNLRKIQEKICRFQQICSTFSEVSLRWLDAKVDKSSDYVNNKINQIFTYNKEVGQENWRKPYIDGNPIYIGLFY